MKVTVCGEHAHFFAASVLDAEALIKDAPFVKPWGFCSFNLLESSQPTAFFFNVPASVR